MDELSSASFVQDMKELRMSYIGYEISPDIQRVLYETMLRIRLVEEKIVELYPEQEMKCPCHLCIGQEAVSSGVCASLRSDDSLFGTYRGHGLYLAKGGDLKAMIAELYGKKTGCTRGKGGSMQLVAPEVGLLCTSAIVGGTLPIAVGSALSAVMQGSNRVTVVVFGEGATEEGIFHESLNFAALKRLPIVFVCEHNYFATYSHQSARQSLDNVYERGEIYGIRGKRIDGNNVLEVFQTVRIAVDRARFGKGPSLVECRTYRWLEHVGPYSDTHLGYRSQEELDAWIARCPVKTFRAHLLEKGILTNSDDDRLRMRLDQEIEEAVAFGQNSSYPGVEDLLKDVYYDHREG